MEIAFWQAYLITLAIETPVLVLFLFFSSRDSVNRLTMSAFPNKFSTKKIIANSLAANTLTLPIVWFVFPFLAGSLGVGYPLQIVVSESFAFAAETLVYWRLFRPISLRDAALASFVCNASSMLAWACLLVL